ncbi:MAG: spoVFA [Oscillospiraceae bacterium]|jgi:dipicolinate synthase subunit A|nr:spoVFA [Oscillospiraceae bacterium]
MARSFDIAIFGGDRRQIYIAKALVEKGYSVCTYQLAEAVSEENETQLHTFDEVFDRCGVLIGPTPLSKNLMPVDQLIPVFEKRLNKQHLLIGGVIPLALVQFCDQNKIEYCDLMKNEKIAISNAVATAEGAIMEAIQASPINLHKSSCLVLGYGRCGRVLAEKLKGMSAQVAVAARSQEALAYAAASGMRPVHLSEIKHVLPECDFVFNTIPVLILDGSHVKLLRDDVVIIDISSAPGGVDYEATEKRKLNARLCLGLPGKVAPKTSAEILVDEIILKLKERGD